MTLLAVDIGNSRLKWGVFRRARLELSGTCLMAAAEWGWLDTIEPPERIVLSCVAGETLRAALQQEIHRRWSVPLNEISSPSEGAGVTNGYSRPSALGPDRWCALVAARARVPDAPVVVADLGSACTIDAMDAHGRHRGGYIVPGFGQMAQALRHGTAQLGFSDIPVGGGAWGRDTAAAVAQGIREAVAGAIERSVRQLAAEGGGPVNCLLTGGDGESILPRLAISCSYLPHLVLEGAARFGGGELATS